MDHDAMWTHVQKLMKFRDDFLLLSKVTAVEFHAMAERVRAGGDPQDVLDEKRGAARGEPGRELEPVTGSDAPVSEQPKSDVGTGQAGATEPTSGLNPETSTIAPADQKASPEAPLEDDIVDEADKTDESGSGEGHAAV